MNNWKLLPFVMAALVMPAQDRPQNPQMAGAPAVAALPPLEVENSAVAVNYGKLKGSTDMEFHGTALFPKASGAATVKSKPDGTTISAKFKDMPPASSFGGAFLTYVLWGVSTEGRATNLGELLVENGKGKLKAVDPQQTFAMVVTAEPYYAVSQPSDVVVLENVVGEKARAQVEVVDTKYQLLKRDQYALNMDSTEPITMDKKTPFDVYQARNAVRIAQSAQAPTYAAATFDKAVVDLRLAQTEGTSKKTRIMEARSAIQGAEDARLVSVRQQRQELMARNRKQAQDQLDAAETARQAALQDAAAAETARTAAQQQAAIANADKNTAIGQADQAKADSANLRAELLAQFGAVLQTRATARGLIVNMSGVLFQNGKATVLPGGREKLAKIAGILATHKHLKVEADGFTDSTGTAAFNLRLSEQRAQNARDYLVSQGVAADFVTAKGFGEENPIAANTTSAGRQENRRVELVVSGEGIN